jgi:hypothetical protein
MYYPFVQLVMKHIQWKLHFFSSKFFLSFEYAVVQPKPQILLVSFLQILFFFLSETLMLLVFVVKISKFVVILPEKLYSSISTQCTCIELEIETQVNNKQQKRITFLTHCFTSFSYGNFLGLCIPSLPYSQPFFLGSICHLFLN